MVADGRENPQLIQISSRMKHQVYDSCTVLLPPEMDAVVVMDNARFESQSKML